MKKSQTGLIRQVGKTMACVVFAFAGNAAFAQDSEVQPSDLEKPPPLPPKVQDEQIEPTVTIREEEDRRIEEYSQNGRVYMVKITPKNGPPYYFMDLDGDGMLERDERSRAFQPVEPAQWKIKEWK